jgi:hypothetical protein
MDHMSGGLGRQNGNPAGEPAPAVGQDPAADDAADELQFSRVSAVPPLAPPHVAPGRCGAPWGSALWRTTGSASCGSNTRVSEASVPRRLNR